MKTKIVTVICVAALLLASTATSSAQDDIEMMADVALVRPGCFLATVLGSAFFVVSLPIAAMSHSVKRSAHVFVGRPAWNTFKRPLGEMHEMQDYNDD